MIICVIVGIVRFSKLYPRYIKYLIPFLLISIFAEAATPLKLIHFTKSNHWFFNLYTTFEFLFYAFLFFQVFHKKVHRTLVLYLTTLGVLGIIVNVLFIQGMNNFHSYSYRLTLLIVIIWSLIYFRSLMQTNLEVALVRIPMFWIATGLFLFSLGIFFYFNAFDYIAYKNLDYSRQLWKIITRSLNVMLYTCFLLSLICQKENKK